MDDCPLCGGTVEEHPVSDAVAAQLREQHENIDDTSLTKLGCTNCGHVLYSRS